VNEVLQAKQVFTHPEFCDLFREYASLLFPSLFKQSEELLEDFVSKRAVCKSRYSSWNRRRETRLNPAKRLFSSLLPKTLTTHLTISDFPFRKPPRTEASIKKFVECRQPLEIESVTVGAVLSMVTSDQQDDFDSNAAGQWRERQLDALSKNCPDAPMVVWPSPRLEQLALEI